jgi:hypothetical protein
MSFATGESSAPVATPWLSPVAIDWGGISEDDAAPVGWRPGTVSATLAFFGAQQVTSRLDLEDIGPLKNQ